MKNTKNILLAMGMCMAAFRCFGQGLPETDVYLMNLSVQDGNLTVDTPENITHRPGYENQPSFLPGGKYMLFVVYAGDQAEVLRYDYINKQFSRITNTPEDEYSPTPMPDGKHFSVVRVEKDSSQRLWEFALDGSSKPKLLIEDVKNIGYHEWLDNKRVALFILSQPKYTLQIFNLATGERDTIAANTGRAFHKLDDNTLLYVVRDINNKPVLMQYHFDTRQSSRYKVNLPAGTEDFIVAPNGMLLSGSGSKLMKYDPSSDKDWVMVTDFKGTPLENFYRLAISPDMKKLSAVSYTGEKP